QNAADGADHTGVVDHAVDVAELLQRRPDQRLDSRLAGDIGAHETTTDLLRHPDTTLDVDIRHHHAAALGGKQPGGRLADAAGGAGNHSDPVAEPRHLRTCCSCCRYPVRC